MKKLNRVRGILVIAICLVLLAAGRSEGQSVSTLVSSGLLAPHSVVIAPDGDYYLSDSRGNAIYRYDTDTDSLLLFAGDGAARSGSTDGQSILARFNRPKGIVFTRGGFLVADTENHTLRFITTGGAVSTFAGAAGTADLVNSADPLMARFRYPTGLAVDSTGNIYVVDTFNNAVRKIDLADNVTTLVTGLSLPEGITIDDGDDIWIADANNNQIKEFSSAGALLNTVGSGFLGALNSSDPTATSFNRPRGLRFISAAGGVIVADTGNHLIRRIVFNATTSTYVTSTVSGQSGIAGSVDGDLSTSTFNSPIGLASDNLSGTVIIVDTKTEGQLYGGGLRQIQTSEPLPQISAPRIGYTTKFTDENGVVSTRFTDVVNAIFNNDVHLAIIGESGTETKFTSGASSTDPFNDTVPDPNETSGSAPFYEEGQFDFPPALLSSLLPDLTIKALSSSPGRKSSTITEARFIFKVANPSIDGDNAASFEVSNQTAGALMYYTTNGMDPHLDIAMNDADPDVFGPVSSGEILGLEIGLTDLTFKIVGLKANYSASGVFTTIFSPTNFSANKITFGFENGEGSSQFVGAADQTFFAPVTLTLLPGTTMNGLAFNMVATNVGMATPAVTGVGYSTMLEALIPGSDPETFVNIPVGFATMPTTDIVPDSYTVVTDNVFENGNLVGLAYLSSPVQDELYDPTLQHLVTYSRALNNQFNAEQGKVIVGGFKFQIPAAAAVGQEYQISINRPSAVVRFDQDVLVIAPDTGTTGPGSLNAIKNVAVGNPGFVVGDAMPFGWFNAGDFGDTNLLANDFLQIMRAAIYGAGRPDSDSDLFKAMDSSDGTANPLSFTVADIAAIDGITAGDGMLEIDDVFVTVRRGLDPNTKWYRRSYNGGVLTAAEIPNQYRGEIGQASWPADELSGVASEPETELPADRPGIRFIAGDMVPQEGFSEVLVEISAVVRGPYPLRIFLLNVNVDPLDGSPELQERIEFLPAPGLGTPFPVGGTELSLSSGLGNYAAAWLNPQFAGFGEGTNSIGFLKIKLPEGVTADDSYSVSFERVSGSPNGISVFESRTRSGILSLSDRSESSFGDGIPDIWRLRNFGSAFNVLSHADADADGDGVPNWKEFKAGTHPNDVTSLLAVKTRAEQGILKLSWPTVDAKKYVLECSDSLFGDWIQVGPVIEGNGDPMEILPEGSLENRFYRVRLIE